MEPAAEIGEQHVRRFIGQPGNELFLQPPCARCGIARFTVTDRDIGALCSHCGWPTSNRETKPMARTMRADTKINEEDGTELEQQPRKVGRPANRPLPIGGNVTDETIREFTASVRAKKAEADKDREQAKKSMGAYRAELKAAKKAGVDPEAIVWYQDAAKMEPEDLERKIAWQNRLAKVNGLPIGTQLGWDLETGETVAHVVDEKQLKGRGRGRKAKAANGNGEADPRAAYVFGYDLGHGGKGPAKLRQFTGDAATEAQKGYQQGKSDLAKELGPEAA